MNYMQVMTEEEALRSQASLLSTYAEGLLKMANGMRTKADFLARQRLATTTTTTTSADSFTGGFIY